MGRILALDYGEKRIGVAVSDEAESVAFPRPVIEAEKKEEILKLIDELRVGRIILGKPIALSGKETKSTIKAEGFRDWLESASGIKVEMADERLSSAEAQRMLRETGMNARTSKNSLDSVAALVLLQSYLNSKK